MFPGLGELLLAAQLAVAPEAPQCRPATLQRTPVVEVMHAEDLSLAADDAVSANACCGNQGCGCYGGCK